MFLIVAFLLLLYQTNNFQFGEHKENKGRVSSYTV